MSCFWLQAFGYSDIPSPQTGAFDVLYDLDLLRRQRSEQYLTVAQSLRHFFRQTKTRPQCMQTFVGK
jgi:hypothetical protein